jgi:hypothetical protein
MKKPFAGELRLQESKSLNGSARSLLTGVMLITDLDTNADQEHGPKL